MEYFNKTWVKICVGLILAATLGFFIGRSKIPEPTIEIKEKIVEKRVVDQLAIDTAVSLAKAEWLKNSKEKVVTRIVTKPNGEKSEETIRETEVLEKSSSESKIEQQKIVSKTETLEKTSETSKIVTPYKPGWSIGLTIHKDTSGILKNSPTVGLDYSASVGKRIIGTVWAEGSYSFKNKQVGLGLKYEF